MDIAPMGTAKRREQDLAMIEHPDDWPTWPKLPLKRKGYEQNMGFLFNGSVRDDTVQPKIYLHSIFEKIDRDNVLFIEYSDMDALLDDGWTVD